MVRKTLYLIFFILLSGCSSIEKVNAPSHFKASGKAILNVPLIKQNNDYSCSTHSLAMIMSYFSGEQVNPDTVWESTKLAPKEIIQLGNNMSGLEVAARSFGYQKTTFALLDLQSLKYLLERGIPVMLNVKNFRQDSYHAVVATGYEGEVFYLNDPVWGKLQVDEKILNEHWHAYLSSPRGMMHKTGFIVFPKSKTISGLFEYQ